ncbi:MAG TPA: hypothetical protein DCL39_12820 [Alteromonas macleodii]|nr:hypothetical protein [Alteromonas macleodii]|tara:strand:- start:781 stop:1575 length:795 start_codon:yes stop_codon:yes gene_type:complete
MTEKKKGPGRPKKAQGLDPIVTRRENKKPSATTVEYELTSPNGALFMMRKASFTFYDEDRNEVRQCRYCEKEKSIFVDEQSEKAILSPLVFTYGKLFVPREKPNLRAFLDLHTSNEANGGNLFRRVDTEKIATETLEDEFLLNDAISLLRTKPLDELLPVATALSINVDRPVDEIKYDLLQKAKASPSDFISSFDNPVVAMKAKVKKAVDYQVIKAEESEVKWFDTNKHIISVPVGQDPVDVFVRYCMTEAGAPVSAEIERQLG